MGITVALAWLVGIVVLGEIRVPLPTDAALRALDASLPNMLPVFTTWGAVAMVETLAAIGWGVIVILAAQGAVLAVGARAGRWLAGRRVPVGLLAEWLLGAGVAGLGLFALALAGLFDRVTLSLVTLWLLRYGGGWAALRALRWPAAEGRFNRFVRGAGVVALAVTTVTLACPETGIDSLIYHLGVPARILRLHRLVAMPSNFLHTVPMLTELLRGWTLGLGGEPAARLWGAVALAAGGAGMAELATGGSWGWMAAALWMTSPWLADLARAGKPDVWIAPLALAAFRWLDQGGRSWRRGIVAGILLGFAAGVKPASIGVLLALLPALVVLRRVRFVALVGAVAGIVAAASAWAARAWLLTGDPVYPFGARGFGMSSEAVAAMVEYSRNVAVRGLYATWRERLVSPWTATFTDGLPALWLAALPFVVVATRKGDAARRLALAGALGWVAWLAGPPQLRYAMPALAWLVAAIAIGCSSAATRFPRIMRGVAVSLLAVQVVHATVAAAASGALLAGVGLEGHGAYAARTRGVYDEMTQRLGETLPAHARVLYVGERRASPAPRPILAPSIYEPFPLLPLIRASATPDELQRRIRQLGVTYVVHNHVGALFVRELQTMNGWTARDLGVWAEYWRRHARLLTLPDRLDQDHGGYYVYRIAAAREAPLPTPTLPGVEGIFASIEGRLRRGELQAVAEQAASLEQVAGDYAEVQYFLGRVIHAGDPWQAAEYLKRADAGEYRDLELWGALARRAEDQWRLDEALAWHREIHAFEPRAAFGDYRRVLGKLIGGARKLRQPEAAERYIRMALDIAPDDASLWAELAEVLLWLDRKAEAFAAMQEAVRLNPHHPGYRGTLGHMMRAS